MYIIICTDDTYPFSYETESLDIEDIFNPENEYGTSHNKIGWIFDSFIEKAREVTDPSLPPHMRHETIKEHVKLVIDNHFSNHIFYQDMDECGCGCGCGCECGCGCGCGCECGCGCGCGCGCEYSTTLYAFQTKDLLEYLFENEDSMQFMGEFSRYWIDFLKKGSWHINYHKEEIWFGTDTPKEGWTLSPTSTGIFFESQYCLFPWRGVLQGEDEYCFIMWAFGECGCDDPEEDYFEVLESCPINLSLFTKSVNAGDKVNKEKIIKETQTFFKRKKT